MQATVDAVLPFFLAEGVYDVPRVGRIYATKVDRERPNDFGDLIGSEVIIAWEGTARVYKVLGIERFLHLGKRYPGESIGLIAEPVEG
jgi:hypothetical protein